MSIQSISGNDIISEGFSVKPNNSSDTVKTEEVKREEINKESEVENKGRNIDIFA